MGLATYGYFEDGLLKTTAYGARLTETRTSDAAGRLTLVAATPAGGLSGFEYAYDADGNRVRQVETRGLTGEETETHES